MIIPNNRIDLWFVDAAEIQDLYLLAHYASLLSVEEESKQKRFRFERHRHQYLVTRAMVRSVLSLYINEIDPGDWLFKTNSYGKPSIGNEPLQIPLCFNISHTGNFIVMAVALDHDVGVDVENLHRAGDMQAIAKRFFSPLELTALQALPDEQQQGRFFDLWTLKEAYIKACGMGLSIPLAHFSFSFSQRKRIDISFTPEVDDSPEQWRFWQIRPDEDHKVALAINRYHPNVQYSLSIRRLIPLADMWEVDCLIERESC
ncbi:MAG: 4'-phosphopantetheinyl transferase superfamily protein [Gammaproteobacteria bacterium]|nr:4'-phosphopantetheinyl transferase superfamily protein [Gammaproteobacteria bacterium]